MIINEASAKFSAFVGKQEKKNVFYRTMNFCIFSFYNGEYLCFNNLTKQLLTLTKDEYDFLNDKKVKNNVPLQYQHFIEDWFLVPIDFDELEFNDQIESVVKAFIPTKDITFFSISPTTDCNARCFYCYEAGIEKFTMDEKTAIETANFIMKVSNKKKILIRWFGGEATYNANAINIICNILKANNVNFTSHMVSNGYLFDDQMIQQAKELWNLEKVHITVDGTENVYNRCKNYIYTCGDSPFQRVLGNIEKLLIAGISVPVRINFDRHNQDDVEKLIDLLFERFSKYKNFSLYPELLYENEGFKKKVRDFSEKYIMNCELSRIKKLLFEKGVLNIRTKITDLKLNACMAEVNNTICINPQGKLEKCASDFKGAFVGDVFDKVVDKEAAKIWLERRPYIEKCKICPASPICKTLNRCTAYKECDEFERKVLLENIEFAMWNSYKIKKAEKNENN